ncbi:UNVERIFIED_CONTAM: hypothetical protein FKN15_016352 [Acipenser sinensis]
MKCHTTLSEQLKTINVEKSPEEPTEPTPPVIVNRERLASLLQLVTKKSENYTVDQLERLFSLLSQCIYQHRRDYDKTHLTELVSFALFLRHFRQMKLEEALCNCTIKTD